MNLNNLFNPKSIAIVGATDAEGKVGNAITKNIFGLGYQGNIFLVNPKHDKLLGQKCYHSLSEIGSDVDLAIISIPARFVVDEIRNNAGKIKNYVIISAGFSEIGAEGKDREEELKKLSEEHNLNILGPNCLGFIVPGINLNASFSSGLPASGNVAFVSQSGALAVGLMDIAKDEDIRFSYIISVGNKMQLGEAELLEYLQHDPNTKVIGMYLEGIKDGKKFFKVASAVSREKPIVIIKAGKNERSQKAISSHTGALAGSDEIISTAFEKSGIIRAETLEEFFNLLNLLSFTDPPANEKVVIVTNAGGPGVLATDSFDKKDITLAEISDKARADLRKYLPDEASLENPIDALGDAREDRYKKIFDTVNKSIGAGSIISVLTPQDQTPVLKIASKIIQFKKKSSSNISTVFIGGDRVKKAIKKLKDNSIPNFDFPDQAVTALDKYYKWSLFKKSFYDGVGTGKDEERRRRALEIIEKAKVDGRVALYFSESKEIMQMYGINTVGCIEIMSGDAEMREITFPAVLKVDSDRVLHKTDKKGLVLNIQNQEELKENLVRMRSDFPGAKLIIQPMADRKTELIIGIKNDAIFGPVVIYGLGGIYTEIFKMVDFLMPPSDIAEIKKSLLESKIKFLFEKTRGQKPYDIEEMVNILSGIIRFSEEIPEIAEFDINPLLIYNDGKKAIAVDVKILI